MKKKVCYVCIATCLSLAAIWGGSQQKKKSMNDLMQENVEALAGNESEDNLRCIGIGPFDCPISVTKVKVILQGYSFDGL